MTEPQALQRLMTWLSPAFPVGSFAWSAGLETAIAECAVTDSTSLQNWVAGMLQHGGLHTDAILLAQAHRAATDRVQLSDLADLSIALTPSKERLIELTVTGDSYAKAMNFWHSDVLERLPSPCPYPIAVGAIAAAHEIDLSDTLLAWLTTSVHSQISVAVRLVPLGQSDGLRVMSALEPLVTRIAGEASAATLADIGTIAYAADIAQMRHETLEPRIFRS